MLNRTARSKKITLTSMSIKFSMDILEISSNSGIYFFVSDDLQTDKIN
jgi:hypothetical protein